MSKPQISLDPNSTDHPYEPARFAGKHGLTIRAAEIILFTNGPSKVACDAVARAFLHAVAARARRKLLDSQSKQG